MSAGRLAERLGLRLGIVLALTLLPIGLMALSQSRELMSQVRIRTDAALMGETLRAAAPQLQMIQQAQGAVAVLSSSLSSFLPDAVSCSSAMRGVVGDGALYGAAVFVARDGKVNCVAPEGSGQLFSSLPLQQMEGDPQSFLSASEVDTAARFFASHPVMDSAGALSGFLSVSIPFEVFQQSNDRLEPKSDLGLVVFDATGNLLAANKPIETLRPLLPRDSTLQILAQGGNETFSAEAVSGERRTFAVVTLSDPRLFAIGSWPRGELGLTGLPKLPVTLFPILMASASLIVALIATEFLVTRHIRSLRHAITRFAGGDRNATPPDMLRAPREIRDVAEAFEQMARTIQRDEADLENTLRQKDALLREVHHRVKNNLQLIASIISMQMRETGSGEARQMMRAVQDRVLSLATVHKDLYQTSHLAEVKADELLPEIVNRVVNLAAEGDAAIIAETHFDDIALDAEQAVPVALLLAEAATQARNEAAGAGGLRKMDVSLRRDGDHALLVVEHAIESSALIAPGDAMRRGLGGQLIQAFTAQLGGTINFDEARGSHRLSVRFPLSDDPGAENLTS
ncbi:MAG: histidine kinase [Cereibacter sphaeroides]|uniref:histidine kinase n=1 Tax=Cereibacter sphaeroides TaxID=1063 RepID=A0A2W5UQV8_CERSP|nr:MAG: histidine kinase [Cereibacter sphaeroides]